MVGLSVTALQGRDKKKKTSGSVLCNEVSPLRAQAAQESRDELTETVKSRSSLFFVCFACWIMMQSVKFLTLLTLIVSVCGWLCELSGCHREWGLMWISLTHRTNSTGHTQEIFKLLWLTRSFLCLLLFSLFSFLSTSLAGYQPSFVQFIAKLWHFCPLWCF